MLHRLDLESFESMYKDRVFRVPEVLRDDKEVMLKIVSKSSPSLIHASDTLQNDRDVVLAAIQNEQPCAPLAIKHASKKLQGDKKIARSPTWTWTWNQGPFAPSSQYSTGLQSCPSSVSSGLATNATSRTRP